MNKVIITMIAIIAIFSAIFTAIAIFKPQQEVEIAKKSTEISQEEILDDCTDEYEGMSETIKTNAEQEKTSPNSALIVETYYKKCGHITNKYSNLPEGDVNLTKEEIQKKYPDYKIKNFTSNEVVLYQEKDGECGEHYLVKDKDGLITIYEILEDKTEKEIEATGITTEYLPETDKINMKKGITVNGKQNLNQLLEDFE